MGHQPQSVCPKGVTYPLWKDAIGKWDFKISCLLFLSTNIVFECDVLETQTLVQGASLNIWGVFEVVGDLCAFWICLGFKNIFAFFLVLQPNVRGSFSTCTYAREDYH